jgi:hypothetical protein
LGIDDVDDRRLRTEGDGEREPTPAACGDSVSLDGVDCRPPDGSELERPRPAIVRVGVSTVE